MGFCFFNNAAIAARHAQAALGAERVAILDFDVHHGNGTQEIFWSDPSVLYASTHQMPLFPGTGARDERGISCKRDRRDDRVNHKGKPLLPACIWPFPQVTAYRLPVEWAQLSFPVELLCYRVDARQIGAHLDKARLDGVPKIILGSPNKGVTNRRPFSVRPIVPGRNSRREAQPGHIFRDARANRGSHAHRQRSSSMMGPFFKRGLQAMVLFGSPSPRTQIGNAYVAIAGRLRFWVRYRTLVLNKAGHR
jgi:hypothetical protein